MTKFFRWQGIAGFLSIVALILLTLMMLAPWLVKISIEKGTSTYTGAEVNVDAVNITWSPLEVEVVAMQITDNKQPSHNLIAFDKASAGIDVWQYLFGRVLIEELIVDGLKVASLRTSPGEVYRDAETSMLAAGAQSVEQQMPAIESQLPDVKDILNDSNLLTVQAANQLEQTYKAEKQKLELLKQQLPDNNTLKAYEAQVKKLSKTKVKSASDISRLQQELDSLKKQFKQDKALIKKSKQQIKQSKDLLSKAVKDVKSAPGNDWQQLESKYQLDKIDNADFAHILFGESARGYYQQAESVYARVKPFLDDNKSKKQQQKQDAEQSLANGRFIHFIDENPLPPWLVKQARLQVTLTQGDFNIDISELTNEHWHRNQPTVINISTDNLLNGADATLKSTVFNSKQQLSAKGYWQFSQLTVNDVDLRDNETLSLSLDSANLAGVGQFSIIDTTINSVNEVNVGKAQYIGASTSSLGRSLLAAIKDVNQLNLSIVIEGDMSHPDYNVDSDLDNIIGKAINSQIQQKLQQFQQQLQAGLNQKVAKSLKINAGDAAEIADIEALLKDTDKALDKLLKSKLADNKKQELEDKLKKKLGKLFG